MNSSFIDVLIGLSLVYLVFSTTCSVITEWWSRLTTAHPLQLRDYVAEMLCDAHWAEQTFYGHPLIRLSARNTSRCGVERYPSGCLPIFPKEPSP